MVKKEPPHGANEASKGAANSPGGPFQTPPLLTDITANPSPLSRLPAANPFIIVAARFDVSKPKGLKLTKANSELKTPPLTNQWQSKPPAPRGSFNDTLEHGHEDDAYTVMAAALYVRQHHFEGTVSLAFLPPHGTKRGRRRKSWTEHK